MGRIGKRHFRDDSAERSQGQSPRVVRSLEVKTSPNVRKKIREAIPLLRLLEASRRKGERETRLSPPRVLEESSFSLHRAFYMYVQHIDSLSEEN